MRDSLVRLEQCVCIIVLVIAVHADLLRHQEAPAPSQANLSGVFVEEGQQNPNDDTGRRTDPLISAIVVKTYNSLNLRSFRSETLFRDGQLVGSWKECRSDGVQFKDCKVLPAYQDRLSIEYTFDKNRVDEYTLHEPSVHPRTSGATGELADSSFRDDLQFTIILRCAQGMKVTSTEVFDLTIPILKDFAIQTRFAKNCSSGINPHVRLGILTQGIPRLLSHPQEQIDVSPSALATNLFIQVSPPAESQIHGLPLLKSSNDQIRASLRGIAGEELIVAGEDLKFSVLYECEVNGVADVNLSVPVPPWDDLSVRIRKKCGGRTPEMLSIGTNWDGSDIVKNGVPSPQFALSTGATNWEESVFQVKEEQSSIKLYIRNTNRVGGETVHLGRIHFTVNDSSVVKVSAEQYGGSAISEIEAGGTVTEKIKLICQRKGSAGVTMSIPIVQYEVVDFRVEKHCRDPISYMESGIESWLTVDGIEDVAFIVVIAILLIGCCTRVRRVGGTEYKMPSKVGTVSSGLSGI